MDNNNPKKSSPLDEIKRITGKAQPAGTTKRAPASQGGRPAPKKPAAQTEGDIPAVKAVAPGAADPSRAEKVKIAREKAQQARGSGAATGSQETRVISNLPTDTASSKDENSKTRVSGTVPAAKKPAPKPTRSAPAKGKEKKDTKNSKKNEEKNTFGKGVLSNSVKAIIYIVAVFVISGCLALFTILVANDCFAFVKSNEEITVKIPKDADLDIIADILHENDIISYPSMFKLYINVRNKDAGEYLSGEFTVSPSMSYDTLISTFKNHTVRKEITITITEGSTTQDIINVFLENGMGTQEGFEEAINNYDFDFWFLEDLTEEKTKDRPFRLEGYLFPDTYNFFTDSSEVDIIYKLLANFDAKFAQENLALVKDLNMTLDDIIILSSMIQNEAKYVNTCKNDLYGSKGDYYMVSAVFHNRINNPSVTNGKLDSDATVLYSLKHDEEYNELFEKIDELKKEIEKQKKIDPSEETNTALAEANKQLEKANKELSLAIANANKGYDSPYNSYMYSGLPAGPICNPSLNAINASMNPDTGSMGVYYYFVADSDGHNFYAKTQAEHDKNIETAKNNAN